MKTSFKVVGIGAAIVALIGLAYLVTELRDARERLAFEQEKTGTEWLSQHQREVWGYVLEWCESTGIATAVNPKDRDGTPSFGGLQFKPTTFRFYIEKYELSYDPTNVMNYEAQRDILMHMVEDPDVKWEGEFPDCIKKYGRPPEKF